MLNIPIKDLSTAISEYQVIELVYQEQLFAVGRHLSQDRSLILQAPKHLFVYLSRVIKKQLEGHGLTIELIDGRNQEPGQNMATRIQRIVRQFETAVSSYSPDTVFLMPYIDVLTSSRTGLSSEAKEIFTLIHENPRIKLLAFEDPEYLVPDLVSQAFFTRIHFLGTPRKKMNLVITQTEARRFGYDTLPVMELYRLLGGQSPIQIRRILRYMEEKPQVGKDTPQLVADNFRAVRELTLSGRQILSPVDMDVDIAGYSGVKKIIKEEILSLLSRSREVDLEEDATSIEKLIPKGLIFYGPPGTGKTLFAQGIAHAIQGTILVVHGPELKSQWVGEGEANIRRLFAQAREHAPAVIVFDELDSIASKREDNNSEASRTMVNQLLTEMDGFRPEDLVFVVGTTNLPDVLDSALLRPGRFQLKIEIPYPDIQDRLDILILWNRKYDLRLDCTTIEKLSKWTSRTTKENTPFAGDHLRSLCQGLKRWVIREERSTITWDDVQAWLKHVYQPDRAPSSEALNFADVAGYSAIKKKLQDEVISVLLAIKSEEDWNSIATWEDILPKGILLEGPPGTGKTYLARAIAGEWGADVRMVSAPEVFSKWVGEGEENIRNLFIRAKSNPPTVIILDEIDALAQHRDAQNLSNGSRSMLLQLMTEMSELQAKDRVLVIATTNTIQDIDAALLRPGRFGTPWHIGYPDGADILELVRFFSVKYVVSLTPGIESLLEAFFQGPTKRGTSHSPDDIRALFQQLKRHVLTDGYGLLQDETVFDTWLNAYGGMQAYSRVLMKRVAIHESGHTLAKIMLGQLDKIEEIRLAMAGASLGYVRSRDREAPYFTESDIKKEIAIGLAGRSAELLVFAESSSGCAEDLEHATYLAQLMAGHFGMGQETVPQAYDSGNVLYPVFITTLQPGIRAILNEQVANVERLFRDNRQILEELADLLLEKKRISANELKAWWNLHDKTGSSSNA